MNIYHVPLFAVYFSTFSFCLACRDWGGLSLGWKFVVPLCGVGLVVFQGFLFRDACVCVLMGGDGSLLSKVKCSVVNFGVSMYLTWPWHPVF